MADHFAEASNMVPRRIKLRRTKGWRLPENTVSVARPGPFGNPFAARLTPGGSWEVYDISRDRRVRLVHTRKAALQLCVDLFSAAVDPRSPAHRKWRGSLNFAATDLSRLSGKNLACWCPPDQPCHADVLLELANRPLRCEAV